MIWISLISVLLVGQSDLPGSQVTLPGSQVTIDDRLLPRSRDDRPDQMTLPGSQVTIDEAIVKARIIVVAELETYQFRTHQYSQSLGLREYMHQARFKISTTLKGEAKSKDMDDLAMSAALQRKERLPQPKEEGIYFFDDFEKRLNAVKVLPKTEKNLEIVRRAIQARAASTK
jgi:hypothetical protein